MEQTSEIEGLRRVSTEIDDSGGSVSPRVLPQGHPSTESRRTPVTSEHDKIQPISYFNSKESSVLGRLETNLPTGSKRSSPTENPRASKELSIYSTCEDLLNTPIKFEEMDRINFTELSACSTQKNDGLRTSGLDCDIRRARRVPDFGEANPNSEETTVVSKEYEEELERQMECLATKNHLSATNVKNIIRAVLTSDDFTKMMQFHLEGKREKPNFELKLTRAKTRQLLAHESVVTWLPTACGKSSQKSDVEILVSDELLEDSSDEEYNPVEDAAHSDDEPKNDEPMADEDIGAEDAAEISYCSTQPLEEDDMDKENIGQRTRSKFSLSETPLEAIAQAFIPPDITTDMYASECDNQDWLNFLKEFDSNVCENNDDDNDPEYNVMMDEDHEDVDVEELRADNAVKVSKKELNALMAELFEYTEMLSSDDEEPPKENECPLNGKATEKTKVSPVKRNNKSPQPPISPVIRPSNFNELEVLLITEQFIKHVQLLVQSYLIGFGNPFAKAESVNEVYNMLDELHSVSGKLIKSGILIANLEGAWQLAGTWKAFCTDPKEILDDLKTWYTEKSELASKKNLRTRLFARPPVHPAILSFSIPSTAFAFPELLPIAAFGPSFQTYRTKMSISELNLLAIGLEIICSSKNYDPMNSQHLEKALKSIQEKYLTSYSPQWLLKLVHRLRVSNDNNPINFFFTHSSAPPVSHYLEWSRNSKSKKLYQLSANLMPVPWSTQVIYYKSESR